MGEKGGEVEPSLVDGANRAAGVAHPDNQHPRTDPSAAETALLVPENQLHKVYAAAWRRRDGWGGMGWRVTRRMAE